MPLVLDRRAGSGFLASHLTAMGIEVELDTLPYADATFAGQGPSGLVTVGIERKTIKEILDAHADPRFVGHQLPGLLDAYDYCWLIIEGRWDVDREGYLLTWPRAHRPRLAREVHSFLTTLEVRGGLRWRRTSTPRETATVIGDLYRWWQRPWADHKSHAAVTSRAKDLCRDVDHETLDLRRSVRPVEAHARLLPGVGATLARRIAAQFGSVEAMIHGQDDQWAAIRGIGPDRLRAIRRHLG